LMHVRRLHYPNERQADEGMSANGIHNDPFFEWQPLYEGFVVKINDRDWTVNIMMFGETTLALLAGNEPEE
jgi:hypothetical protein